MIKRFCKLFLKQSKRKEENDERKLMATTTNCFTNHANLLVIVASHGSLAITSPWLQETIQSMTHKIILSHSNHTSILHNKLQATIRSSIPSRGEHKIKKTLQVSLLVSLMLEC